ncbi:unnamed protein product [Phyllotreta striolata]|uniref:RING-type E3 ubiquitin transferase n=1 Tax=Phyllotreta striolata TaxID=444603 RepID=A0A9N9TP73_PHYSR|nr:unnamed protein product [Phyllotreta striolata]
METDNDEEAIPELTDEEIEEIEPIEEDSPQTPDKCEKSYEDDEGSICPICLDYWTNAGDNRISSLKCGHLFCRQCLLRWLDSPSRNSCPTCKKRARKSDIRPIYARRLTAVDNSQIEALRDQLSAAIEEKHKFQLDISKYACRESVYKQRIIELEAEIVRLNRTTRPIENNRFDVPNKKPTRLYLDKSLEICKKDGCRVFDSNNNLNILIASSKSPSTLFAGFGVRSVDLSTYKPTGYVPLHQQQIRDVSFHTSTNLFVTVSMDKSFKVTDIRNARTVSTAALGMPLWSCCWDSNSQYYLYVGTQSGSTVKYDIRNLNETFEELSIPGDMSPVVSLASINNCNLVGLVSCKLNSLWLFEERNARHPINLNGPFVSMKYDRATEQLLVSSRPNNLVAHSTHTLCTLKKTNEGVNCDTVHVFTGGGMQKLLSKSCFVSDAGDYVAAYEETGKCVCLWSINTGARCCAVPAKEAVLDLKGVRNGGDTFLVSLTERNLDFYKFF